MRTVAAVLALVACVHAGVWASLRATEQAPDFSGQLASISYAPFADSQHPDFGDRPTAEQIRADLKAIAPYTRAIRTYSATGGAELVPPIAAEFGLKVTVGAWIDKNQERNEREIRSALDLARHYSNVNGIVVGNETVFRGEMTIEALIKLIHRVKRSSSVPVTTGEIWSVWIDHPELASAVDFIAAHILPYWEGFDAASAVDHTIEFYDKLRRLHPGKRVVIAEFGWPSAGYNFHNADPGRIEQAFVIRDFVHRAEAYGIDYNIVEAIDQKWKTFEGGVGPYWGLFDASRQAKFSWTGPIADPDYVKQAGLAVLLGLLLSLPILRLTRATTTQALMLAACANLVGAWFAAIVAFWKGHYFVPGAAFALGFGVVLLVPLVAIALARAEEIAAIAFGRPPRRLATAPPLAPPCIATILPREAGEGDHAKHGGGGPACLWLPTCPLHRVAAQRGPPPPFRCAPRGRTAFAPKVSIHIPAYREPAEMLKTTLDAVARLDYPNLECVVVINNTPDPSVWQPVEQHCAALGDRFKFVRIENLDGYKAGALGVALARTAADAEVIGVIDADYVVDAVWLKDLVPLFADPRVGLVQSPQDHRDGDRSPVHRAMNAEYAGFFDIGMVQRNEVNAIIIHGTMCLVRRAAIEAAGGWASDTIVEDSDLGLSILALGWLAHYTDRRYGYGLLPATFDAYKQQRQRWAFGGFQLVRKHWRRLLPWTVGLTREQKREYALGWLNWLGADSIGVVVALLNIAWVPVVAFADIAVPDRILTLPILGAFAVSVIHFAMLYRLRVRVPVGGMLGAVCAAMSVQWTVARAVGSGVVRERLPFLRTVKGGASGKVDFPAFWETVIAGLLLLGALILVVTNYKQVREINIFAVVLLVQSLPFLSASVIALIEDTRFNTFAYWRGLKAKALDLLPQRRVMVERPKLPADNPAEAAQ